MRYLIDTDWIIHYFNGNEGIIKKINSLREEGLGISIISLSEIYEGIYYSNDPPSNERALEDFLSGVSVLNINYGICRIFGRERGRLRKRGILISDFDLLIASTCLYYDLTLLTNNVRHFERVENLKILSSY